MQVLKIKLSEDKKIFTYSHHINNYNNDYDDNDNNKSDSH
jgi:hypothetical protein